jgi:hypothetical protein
MKKRVLSLLAILLICSCIHKGFDSKPIPFDEIVGIYELKNKSQIHRIELYNDSTFQYMIMKGGILVENKFGRWKYEQYTNYNIVILENKPYFWACKIYGKITLANKPFPPADPDGAPILRRYKKIK